MVYGLVDIDAVFRALSHDARRQMLGRLAAGELTVGQLAQPLDMSLPAASKHIAVLERVGLVARRVEGRRHVCRLIPGPLASADAWLHHYEHFWNERLDRLTELLQAESAPRQEIP